MGMNIEVIGKTWYTVCLTDEDVEKVKQYMKDHEDCLPHGKTEIEEYQEENFCWAVKQLVRSCEIELYSDGKATESDFRTDEISWSEFEDRTPEEILEE